MLKIPPPILLCIPEHNHMVAIHRIESASRNRRLPNFIPFSLGLEFRIQRPMDELNINREYYTPSDWVYCYPPTCAN